MPTATPQDFQRIDAVNTGHGSSLNAKRIIGPGAAAVVLLLAIPGSLATGARAEALEEDDRDAWSFTLGIGGFVAPDYVGSDDVTIRPFPLARIQKDVFYVETDGPGIRANIVPHGLFEFGPIVRYGEGRADVEDAVVDRLPEIDDALWIGLFAGFAVNGILGPRDSLTFKIEGIEAISQSYGLTVTLGSEYGIQATERLSLAIGLSTTYADTDYADTYFSVSDAGAAASGLPAFEAGSGVRDVSLTLSGRYALTEALSVGAMAGAARLLGDFADSPVVRERGSDTSAFGGAFAAYTF